MHGPYESLHHTYYCLLIQSDEHHAIDIVDQSDALWYLKLVQIPLEYIITQHRRVNIAGDKSIKIYSYPSFAYANRFWPPSLHGWKRMHSQSCSSKDTTFATTAVMGLLLDRVCSCPLLSSRIHLVFVGTTLVGLKVSLISTILAGVWNCFDALFWLGEPVSEASMCLSPLWQLLYHWPSNPYRTLPVTKYARCMYTFGAQGNDHQMGLWTHWTK